MVCADYLNRNGSNVGARVLLVVVAILNAFRNSFTFFLLLIVCMGYGVVKPSLGKTMTYVRFLAIAHFVFGLVYAITSLLISPDTAGRFNVFLFHILYIHANHVQAPWFSLLFCPWPVLSLPSTCGR